MLSQVRDTIREDPDRDTVASPSPGWFFGLVLVLTIPFWVVGALVDVQLLPGIPISASMFLVPGLAAALLSFRSGGNAGVTALLRRCVDFNRIKPATWYLPILIVSPAAFLLSYWIMRWIGLPLPTEPSVPWSLVPVLALVFFVSGSFEQAGWMGYAFEPLQQRYQALPAALILGAFWAVWHFVPLVQGGRSAGWIAWWTLGTVAIRVLMAWIFNNTGSSVFATILFQVVLNVGLAIFPNRGSHYDPMVTGIILTLVAIVVVLVWGPRTLAHRRDT